MKLNHFLASGAALVFCINLSSEPYPWLSKIDYENTVFESGERLMQLDYGLHALEEKLSNEHSIVIAIHGSRSRGYEWVYPLKTLDTEKHDVYFFRWNDEGCPNPPAIELNEIITKKISQNNEINKIILISHSYGGLLTSWFYDKWIHDIPMEIHAIATPLAGMQIVNNLCGYEPPNKIVGNVSVNQWITKKELDNAFKDLKIDPQIINLNKNKTNPLPTKYKNRRLGHNWSISYVADQIRMNHKDMKK